MKRILTTITLIATLMPVLAFSRTVTIEIVNVMPSFFKIDGVRSLGERVQRFKESVLCPNRALYRVAHVPLDDPHIAWYLAAISPKMGAIERETRVLERTLPTYETTFESALPKFDPNSVRIYLMPSLGTFDGMTKEVNGKHGLLIGVDNAAQEDFPTGVFVDHELFHIYHHEINPSFFVTSSENDLYQYGLYRQIWAEGLATYVSQKLNPGTTDAQALASADLAQLSDSDRQKLACFVSDNLDSTQSGYAGFLFDENQHPKGFPPRAGYYMGYIVARRLGGSQSIAQLADLSTDAVRTAIATDVHALCAPRR